MGGWRILGIATPPPRPSLRRTFLRSFVHLLIWCLSASVVCAGAPTDHPKLLYVHLDHQPGFSKLMAGGTLGGELARSVYFGERELFPAGSRIGLVVDRMERRKKERLPDDRPFVIRAFSRKQESFPIFRSGSIVLPGGAEVPIQASFLKLTRRFEIRASVNGKAKAGSRKDRNDARPVMILALDPAGVASSPLATAPNPAALAAGTRVRLILMQSLSASRNHRGDGFQARLAEPVRLGSGAVLPEGSLFEGLVTSRIPPRRLGRPGSLHLGFTKVTLPGGVEASIAGSLASVEADKGSHLKIDPEGGVHGGGPGVARLLLETGVTAGIAKITDDSAQLLLELLISGATDASTAGAARIVAAAASGLFLLTRHGRDAILPRYTEMEVILSRAGVSCAPGRTFGSQGR